MSVNGLRAPPSSLSRRVQQIVQLPLDSPDVRQTLQTLAASYESAGCVKPGLSGLARHRDLRADMQMQSAQMDADFVTALGLVDEVFAELEASVEQIDQRCAQLRMQVDGALRATAGVAAQVALMSEEQAELRVRREMAAGLLARLTLSPQEAAVLERVPLEVGAEFFAALDRVAEARAECRRLGALSKSTREPDKAEPAIAEAAEDLERRESSAHEGLLRWVQSSVRDQLNRDSPEFDMPLLRRALQRLRPHRALFDSVVSEVISVRREAVARGFTTALVRGGPNGLPRPIEAHAGDPQRYVGDMLAWVHQACASEKDLLYALLSGSSDEDPAETAHYQGFAELLAMSLEGVAEPLEIRVVQTIEELHEPAALFRISSLLAFYAGLFTAVCRTPAARDNTPETPASPAEKMPVFMTAVASLASRTHELLVQALNSRVAAVVDDFDSATTAALDAPASLDSLMATVAEIIRLHADSMSFSIGRESATDLSSAGPDASLPDIIKDITLILDRTLQEARTSSQQSSTLRPYERCLFELNVLGIMQTAIALPAAGLLDGWLVSAQKREEELVQDLGQHLLDVLKARSHLPFGSTADNGKEPQDFVASIEQIEAFNRVLKMATEMDVSRLVSRLLNQNLARSVAQSTTELFVQEYAQLHSKITAEYKDQPILTLLLSPETVSTLL
ncbi:Golgi transport complex subunit 6 [Coemansia sp. Benny D115]|nr:Golgi transport complex subunit 6 [Coemansia sp. Benny D115]